MYKLLHFGIILTKLFQFDSLGNYVKYVLIDGFINNFGYSFGDIKSDCCFSNENYTEIKYNCAFGRINIVLVKTRNNKK